MKFIIYWMFYSSSLYLLNLNEDQILIKTKIMSEKKPIPFRKRDTPSRVEKRAEKRLQIATNGYLEAQTRKTSGQFVHKPGKQSHYGN
jgi:hypothetical protein